ncbi:hypothetical protein V3564_01950 [Bartonella sp. B12(2025)]
MQQGEYGVVKNVIKDVLDHGQAHGSEEGETKSAISPGTIILSDEAGQELTGQGAQNKP